MLYLSSPYSHPSPAVREQRFQAACKATAALLKRGKLVFSPIVHSHPLVPFAAGESHGWWMNIDEQYLRACKEVYVLTIDGWAESRGVLQEMEWARDWGMPICFVNPKNDELVPTPLTGEWK